jgi:hypothetical protein
MSADATAPPPEPDYSYSCDYTTRLSNVFDITESSGQVTTYQYSVERRPRSRESTTTTKDGSPRCAGPTARSSDSTNSDRRGRATAAAGRSALPIQENALTTKGTKTHERGKTDKRKQISIY